MRCCVGKCRESVGGEIQNFGVVSGTRPSVPRRLLAKMFRALAFRTWRHTPPALGDLPSTFNNSTIRTASFGQ